MKTKPMEQQSSSNHVDKSVILLLLGTMLVAMVIFGFKALHYEPCEIVNFEVRANQYNVGEIIRFQDYTENVQRREWQFGDGTEIRHTQSSFHTYDAPGTYTVKLIVNDKCESEKKLVINEKIEIIDSTKIASFKVPNTIKVGELLTAYDKTKEATSWEWRFGETSEVNSTFQNPTYTYQTEGLKTITLIVNGDPRYSSQKKIRVLPKSETTSPRNNNITQRNRSRVSLIKYKPTSIYNAMSSNGGKGTMAPEISKNNFANNIINVSRERATAQDFKPYLCGNLQATTIDKGRRTTFIEFCDKIKGKKIKIKSLEIFQNEDTGCIEYISIDYAKRLF